MSGPAHTPTPGQVIEDDDGSFNLHSDVPAGDLMDYIGAIENHDDATFIVRAVNCHDELAEAVKNLIINYEGLSDHTIAKAFGMATYLRVRDARTILAKVQS